MELFEREGPEALVPFADSEIEIFTEPRLINAGTYRGHDGFLAWSAQWLDAWKDFRMEPLDFIEVGDEIVVVALHQVARGRGSGVPVEMDIAYLVQLRGGKVTRLHLYTSTDDALEVAEELAGEAS